MMNQQLQVRGHDSQPEKGGVHMLGQGRVVAQSGGV